MKRFGPACIVVLLLCSSCVTVTDAQSSRPSSPNPQSPTITVRSNLVLVPALVKNKAGDAVFSLTADDFMLTDDGVPQPAQLELDTDSQPLALAVIAQTGGLGASHLDD
jgi:hypothetical protein